MRGEHGGERGVLLVGLPCFEEILVWLVFPWYFGPVGARCGAFGEDD